MTVGATREMDVRGVEESLAASVLGDVLPKRAEHVRVEVAEAHVYFPSDGAELVTVRFVAQVAWASTRWCRCRRTWTSPSLDWIDDGYRRGSTAGAPEAVCAYCGDTPWRVVSAAAETAEAALRAARASVAGRGKRAEAPDWRYVPYPW